MFYQFLKVIMTLAFRVYFRRIEVKGRELIPKDGPVLLACNHPSSFMEGCLVSCFQDRELHYLVRGDVFSIKWLRPVLIWTNQIPIYRFRDGFSSLKKNQDTFNTTYRVLSKGEAVIIYPEGSTALVKQLRPLQKGLAKMSMGTLEEYPDLPLKIVPVGVNYNDATSFRSSVTISIGEEIDARQYFHDFEEEERRTYRKMTLEVYDSLVQHIIHLDHPDEEAADSLLTGAQHFNTDVHSGVKIGDDAFGRQQQLASQLNTMTEDQRKAFQPLRFPGSLTSLDLTIFQRTSTLFAYVTLFLLAPFALAGYILNFPPYAIAKYIGNAKVKVVEFQPPVRIAVWALLQLVLTLILCLGCLIVLGGLFAFLPLIFPVLGLATIYWYEGYVRVATQRKYGELIDQIERSVEDLLTK